MTFENVTLEQFKQAVAEFSKAAESGELDEDQLDNGLKAVHLLYFGLPSPEEDRLTNVLALGYLQFAQGRHLRALLGNQRSLPQEGDDGFPDDFADAINGYLSDDY